MSSFARPQRAFVRPVPASFQDALRADPVVIDLDLARHQHAAYVQALRDAGIAVVELPAADDQPDSVFVEDPVVVVGQTVVRATMGAPSRRGEGADLLAALTADHQVEGLGDDGATLDGGDVLRVGQHLLVGLSSRTNPQGAAALGRIARRLGLDLLGVPVRRGLHLKSALTLAAPGLVVLDPGAVDRSSLNALGVEILEVDEPQGANVLCLGDLTLASSAAPRTAEALRRRGIAVVELGLSELHKADGALTCCSVRLPAPGRWCV